MALTSVNAQEALLQLLNNNKLSLPYRGATRPLHIMALQDLVNQRRPIQNSLQSHVILCLNCL